MQHLDDGLLHELVDGEVSSEQLGPIQQHLAECATCRARLAAARELTNMTDGLIEALDVPDCSTPSETPVLPLPVPRSASRWGRTLGLAASLTVAAGVGYAVRDVVPPPRDDRAIVPVVVPGTSTPPPADAVLATEEPAREETPPASVLTPAATAAAKPTPEPAVPAADIATQDQVVARRPDRADAGIEPQGEVATPKAAEAARAAAPALATGRAQSGLRERIGVSEMVMVPRDNSLVPRDAASASAKQAAPPVPVAIDFGEAIALLGGRLRLVEGLVPSRLERIGDEVRVIYPIAEGELVLSQRPGGDSLYWHLSGPPAFPVDSLEVLRRRVGP
jgi:hypothetical protein